MVDADSLQRRLVAAWRVNTDGPGPKEALPTAVEALTVDARALGDPGMLFKVRIGCAYALRFDALDRGSARARSEMFGALREYGRAAYAEPDVCDWSHVKAMWVQLFIILDRIIEIRPEPADPVRRLIDELERHVQAGRPRWHRVGSAWSAAVGTSGRSSGSGAGCGPAGRRARFCGPTASPRRSDHGDAVGRHRAAIAAPATRASRTRVPCSCRTCTPDGRTRRWRRTGAPPPVRSTGSPPRAQSSAP
ncbi:hypothetical protein BJF79_17815 [Actinomadura sp. CNU-125]|nr:hypothetical protein BJF79_17815 [Actinomadura sp. CNU-125]